MPSARDHPFNQSQRPLLDRRSGPMNNRNLAHDDEEEEDDDYGDYEDISNNNNTNSAALQCDFKSYGFVRKFTKAPAIASSSHNEKNINNNNVYNGFHDFNAIPRANGEDVGYPYGEKVINEKQPIGLATGRDMEFKFQDYHNNNNNNQMYLNNHQNSGTLTRKLNNQHVNLYNNFNHQTKVVNRSEPDFANRPLPQTPTGSTRASPLLLGRQRPVPTAVVSPKPVTPQLCRANRKGPFIFGVDSQHQHQRSHSNSTSHSSPAGSPLLSQQQHHMQQRRLPAPPTGATTTTPVIEEPHWKYSENHSNLHGTAIRRRDVFQRTQNTVQPHHDTLWDPNKEIWEDKQRAKQQQKHHKKNESKKLKCKSKKGAALTKDNPAAIGTVAVPTSLPTVKCVIVGDAAVGKTNLITSYLENRFVQEHIPTASDIYNGEVEVDGSPIHVTLCDTAGQDTMNASALREICYAGCDVFLVCFSVVNPETYRSVQTNWIPQLTKRHKGASVILIGTQSDLRNDQSTIGFLQMQGEKPVSFTDAWDYARSIGAKYVESSSRTKEKVKDAFDTAIWDALVSQKQQQSIKKTFWRRIIPCLG